MTQYYLFDDLPIFIKNNLSSNDLSIIFGYQDTLTFLLITYIYYVMWISENG